MPAEYPAPKPIKEVLGGNPKLLKALCANHLGTNLSSRGAEHKGILSIGTLHHIDKFSVALVPVGPVKPLHGRVI